MGVTHSYSSRLFLCALEWGLRLNYIPVYPHVHNAVHFQLRIVFCVLAAVCCILCMGGAQLNLHYVLLTFTVENYASTVQQRPKWNPALEQIKFNGMTISAAAAF